MKEINLKELAEHLALEKCKDIYGDHHETLYVNNYHEFRGYVLRPAVKITFNKMYSRYNNIISSLIKKQDEI
tara:strand:- start:237 stop:452 length:216 start_codon:yes stop_codon:yes gene_type:complete